jgi:hypothetical protein
VQEEPHICEHRRQRIFHKSLEEAVYVSMQRRSTEVWRQLSYVSMADGRYYKESKAAVYYLHVSMAGIYCSVDSSGT